MINAYGLFNVYVCQNTAGLINYSIITIVFGFGFSTSNSNKTLLTTALVKCDHSIFRHDIYSRRSRQRRKRYFYSITARQDKIYENHKTTIKRRVMRIVKLTLKSMY
jgi:hypothetical protein